MGLRNGNIKRWVFAVIAAMLALPLTALPSGAQTDAAQTDAAQTGDADGSVTVTILHSSDGESQLLPDAEAGMPGVARFVAALRELRAAATGPVVTLSAGDHLMASPAFDASVDRDGPLYDSVALSGIFDAIALGDRDFDLGAAVTARFIAGFDPAVPVVSANLDVSDASALAALSREGVIAPSTVITAVGQRIGVVGALTPQLSTKTNTGDVTASAAVVAAQAAVDQLTADGVDKIILLSHMRDAKEESALVTGLKGVDIVVAGALGGSPKSEGLASPGSKDAGLGIAVDSCRPSGGLPLVPSLVWAQDADGNRVPVASAPRGYRCVGVLNVTFDADGKVTTAEGASVEVLLDCRPDRVVQAAVVLPLSEALTDGESTAEGTSEGACQELAPALAPGGLVRTSPSVAAPVTSHGGPAAGTPATSTDPVDTSGDEYRTYTVQPGDLLWLIAQRELGDASLAEAIFVANRGRPQNCCGVFTNPNLIYPGWVLRLPTTP